MKKFISLLILVFWGYGNSQIIANEVHINNVRHVWVNPFEKSDEWKAILDWADYEGAPPPTNDIPFDQLIKDLKSAGIWQKLDVFYVFAGDGSDLFKLINWVDPSKHLADAYGGLTWDLDGIKGNGSNGYIDTNFNPNIDHQNYTLNNASRGGVISEIGTMNFDGIAGVYRNDYNGSTIRLNGSASTTINYDNSGGLLTIKRNNSSTLDAVMKDNEQSANVGSSFVSAEYSQVIMRRVNAYGSFKLSCYFLGGYLTYAETQTFRTIYNNFLTALGLTPVA